MQLLPHKTTENNYSCVLLAFHSTSLLSQRDQHTSVGVISNIKLLSLIRLFLILLNIIVQLKSSLEYNCSLEIDKCHFLRKRIENLRYNDV